MGNGEEEMGS
uniref:Uncharacterized protein n=1 Tax=Arundo donax TaxID=35708 RepID=A0A0A8ZR23_ARUDO